MLLDLIFGQPARKISGSDGWLGGFGWGNGGGPRRTQAAVTVSEDLALTYSAVWRATQIISSTEGRLPLVTYRRLHDGNKEEADDHGLYPILRDEPNPDMDSMTFREGRTVHQLNWGNGFAEIERGPSGNCVALWPIHPNRVKPVRREDRDQNGNPLLPEYRYRVRNNDGSEVVMRAADMLHIPGSHAEDGIWGKGTVAHARESIGMGLATERHGATYFGSGAQPPGVIYLPGLKDSEARKEFRREWKQIHGSPDSGEVAILPVEGKYEKIGYPPEDSQFLGTRTFNVREIARWYGVPSHLLGDLEKASYNSIEQLGIDFVAFSLMQWLKRWEGQIQLKLIPKADRRKLFVEHDISELLRGDKASMYQTCVLGLTNGFLSINDVRRLLNMNSIGPQGDSYRVPLNTATLEMAGIPRPPVQGVVKGDVPGSDKPKKGDAPQATPEPSTGILRVPDRRQVLPYDCGAACVNAVAAFLDVDNGREEADYIAELDSNATDGTKPAAIVSWFVEQGLTVSSGTGWSIDDLKRLWRAGQPVICPIQDYGTEAEERANESGHYVCVVGFWDGFVFAMDPSADNAEAGGRPPAERDDDNAPGYVMISEERWDEVWHDMDADGKTFVRYGIAVGEGPAAVGSGANGKPAGNQRPIPDESNDKTKPSPAPADSDSRDRAAVGTNGTGAHV